MDLMDVRVEHFEPLVSQDFNLENSEVKLKLLEAKALKTREGANRTAFALLFASPVPAPQGTYTLQHEALGKLEIFLVPIRQDGAGVHLEAIFT
jgi:hypothetical protein